MLAELLDAVAPVVGEVLHVLDQPALTDARGVRAAQAAPGRLHAVAYRGEGLLQVREYGVVETQVTHMRHPRRFTVAPRKTSVRSRDRPYLWDRSARHTGPVPEGESL